MKSVVLTIRGSWSVSDVFTDLAAAPRAFHAEGMPKDTVAHYGMSICCEKMLAALEEDDLLEKALCQYPEYGFVVTGHSLGAGLAVLIGAKLRPRYPNLMVYGFATPSSLLSREAAKYTEQFTFTICIGDDFAARTTVEAVESLKFGIVETLESCKLPKVRIDFDIANQWSLTEELELAVSRGLQRVYLRRSRNPIERPRETLVRRNWDSSVESFVNAAWSANCRNHFARKFCKPKRSAVLLMQTFFSLQHAFGGNPTVQVPRRKLYVGGRILHIVRKKKSEMEKGSLGSNYEMRWATPEDFLEMKVMPRMILDHFPQNIMKVLTSLLKERKSDSTISVEQIWWSLCWADDQHQMNCDKTLTKSQTRILADIFNFLLGGFSFTKERDKNWLWISRKLLTFSMNYSVSWLTNKLAGI